MKKQSIKGARKNTYMYKKPPYNVIVKDCNAWGTGIFSLALYHLIKQICPEKVFIQNIELLESEGIPTFFTSHTSTQDLETYVEYFCNTVNTVPLPKL